MIVDLRIVGLPVAHLRHEGAKGLLAEYWPRTSRPDSGNRGPRGGVDRGMRASSLVFVCLVTLWGESLSAMCASEAYWVWPPSGPVPPNVTLLVETYGKLQDALQPGRDAEVELRGADEVIPLEPLLSFRGEFLVRQTLFRPARELSPGVEYQLFAPAIAEGPLIYYTFAGQVAYSWTANAWADLGAPVAQGAPEVTGSRYVPLGCGPQIQVDVAVPMHDESPVLVLAEVVPDGETIGVAGSYLLPVTDGAVTVGHGMCSGAFRLQPGGRYSLRMQVLDAAGNRALPWHGAVEFEVPSGYVR